MNLQSAVVEVVVAVVVIGWIMYRQTRWQLLDAGRLWRGPIVLAVIGVVQMKSVLADGTLSVTAIALLAVSAVLAVAVGLAMGLLSQVRTGAPGLEARTGWVGSLLWLVLLAVRIGVDVCAHLAGAAVVTSVGAILLVVALNRAGRAVVLARRAEQARMVAAH
ncbi:hypothetical protein D7D52_12125 [Nocardia yunnanensis]|uniref:DUF1453 domain-containing protein n=1 Tax=Nocardia yunnanensis TaxID=2382165 RepID=A0A386ZBL3_9NOCA|nr:hypothetical protein [Nocardia yunnanensis]AYF74484.1 hypothetical protein D7D52_12125 [Nocardia yunnanensis]